MIPRAALLLLPLLCADGCAPATRADLRSARALLAAGRPEQACPLLERELARGPGGSRARQLTVVRLTIDCLSRTGALDRARPLLVPLTEGLRLYGEALLAVAGSAPDLPRALQLLGRAGRLWSTEAEIPYRVGVLLLSDEQPAAALQALQRASHLRDTAAAAVARAHALLDLGRDAEAMEQARRVIHLRPASRDVGRARDLVERRVRRSRQLPPSAAPRYRSALDLLQRQDRAAACIQLVEELLLDHPDLAAAHALLGLAHLRLGNAAEAVVALRRADQLNPIDATSSLYLAVIYQRRGQLDESVGAFRRALSLDPFSTQAALTLGRLLLEARRPAEAAIALERAVILDGGADSSLRLAARAHLAAGAPARAEAHLRRLERRSPDDFEANLRLGQILLGRCRDEKHAGLCDEARLHARRATRAQPDDAEATALVDRLQP